MINVLAPFVLFVLFPAAARREGEPPASVSAYDAVILREAERRRLNPRLVKAVVATESGFTPDATSPAGARGLMQLMPATAEEMGVPAGVLEDPEQNVRAGTAYLAWLFALAWRREGRPGACCLGAPPGLVRRVLAAYHAGPRLLDARARWPQITRLYVRDVQRYARSRAAALRPAG